MCSSRTLAELRRYWTSYSKADEHSKSGKRLEKLFAARTTPERENFEIDTRRAMGAILAIDPTEMAMFKFGDLFDLFWNTGTTRQNPTDIAAATLPNPTFAYSLSGEGFFVDERTNPLLPFHLASAVTSIRVGTKVQKGARNFNQVVEAVKVQFNEGCKSFKTILSSPGALVIRLFTGDPLPFLLALRRCSPNNPTPCMYSTQWSFSPLHLDGGDYGPNATSRAPLEFNVIETSSLANRLGLLNVLTSIVPLLSRNPSSVIHTETLLSYRGDEITGFMDRLIVGISMTSLMLGLAPSSYLTRGTSRSNTHEVFAHTFYGHHPPFHDRIAWKFTTLGDTVVAGRNFIDDRPLVFDSQELGKLLFTVYLKMFSPDKVYPTDTLSSQDLQEKSRVRYIPESLAIFLKIVKGRTNTDWRKVMETLFLLVEEDTTIPLGINYYEDFCCQLHIHGVYTVDALSPDQTTPEGPFRGWTSVPPLVCIVFDVRRKNVKPLNVPELKNVGLPLQCEVRVVTENGNTLRHIFSSVQTAFGTIKVQKDSKTVIIVEDRLGWSGDDPLLVSFWVPSWLLSVEPDATTISLAVRQTPANTFLRSKLDLSTVPLYDPSVHVLDEQPNLGKPWEPDFADDDATPETDLPTHQAVVALNDSYRDIETLSVRTDIIGREEERTWGSGATVKVSQASPCIMKVTFGTFERLVIYPYPVDGSRARSRVARKSLYIEVSGHFVHLYQHSNSDLQVIVPISGPGSSGGFSLNPFPVFLRDRKMSLWNIHRVNCDRLPVLDILDTNDWTVIHIGLSMSTREKTLHDLYVSSPTNHDDVLANVKNALCSIISFGFKVRSSRVLGFSQSIGGIDTLIFVTDVYLDLASHTLIADAFILPLTVQLVTNIHKSLFQLHQVGIVSIEVFGESGKALKRLLPVFTERCRRWEHTPTCEYVKRGVVPLTVDREKIPICSCGMGKGVEKFMKVPEWRNLGLEKFVTRAAIGLLFAASYLEHVGPSKDLPVK